MMRILKRPTEVMSPMRLPLHSFVHGGARSAATGIAPRDGTTAPSSAHVSPALESTARAELEALRDTAMREGREHGYAAAQKETRAAMDAELQRSRRVLDGMDLALQEKLSLIEPLAVRIAFEALSMLMGEAYARGEGVVQAVRSLMVASAGATRLRVQVPPAQLDHVRAALASPAEDVPSALSFEADPTLMQSCRVVSERGQLETGLGLQLQAVQDALLCAAQTTHAPRDPEATR